MSSIFHTGYFIRESIEKLLMPTLGMDRGETMGEKGATDDDEEKKKRKEKKKAKKDKRDKEARRQA